MNATTGIVVAARAEVAAGWFAQLRGLIGRAPRSDFALGLPRCAQVHTAFLRAPLDVAFCDPAGRVLCLVRALPPWRTSPRAAGAAMAWETAEGCLGDRVRVGDVLKITGGV